jgi:hypothetical protein
MRLLCYVCGDAAGGRPSLLASSMIGVHPFATSRESISSCVVRHSLDPSLGPGRTRALAVICGHAARNGVR